MSDTEDAGDTEPVRRIGVREFRGNLNTYLRQVRRGSVFLVTSKDQVLAEVRPPREPAHRHRRPGTLRGKIHMAGDFDTLPPDILAAIEGDGE